MADLRQLPTEDFMRLIQGVSTNAPDRQAQTNRPGEFDVSDLPPAVQSALTEANRQINRAVDPSLMSTAAQRMGVRPEAFLDISKGAPAGVRMRLGLDENQLNQFKLLTQLYGPGNVDLSDDGRFILRNQPTPSGAKEDIMVDPIGIDRGDIAQMGSQIVPMIAGSIAARFGGKVGTGPVTKALGGVTAMALGMETTGAAQDVFVRWLRDNDINFSEIARHRAAAAVVDEVFGLAVAGGAKALSKAAEGILGVGQIPVGSTATKEAQKKLMEQTGVKFPLTPGQESESALLLRLESMTGERIGTASSIDRMRQAQTGAENELRRVFLGLPRTMSDDELAAVIPQADIVGQKGLTRLGSEALQLESGVARAAQVVQETGTAEAQKLAGVSLASPLDISKVGQFARAKTVSDFAKFKEEMGKRYEAFLANPEITSRTISGNQLASAAGDVEKKLIPAAQKTTQEASPILDPFEREITREVTEIEPLESFVASKVKSFIGELKGLRGAQVSVNDLKQIRTSIDNAISEGIAIPGTDIKQLVSLKSGVDEAITSALKGMKDKSLLPTWENLSKDFAQGMSRFDKVGIREMLIKEGERGAVGSAQIAESVIGNTPQALDRYNAFKDFFGVGSSEFRAIQQVARQKVLVGSLSELSGYVDGPSLRAQIRNLRPEVAEELFGINRAELHRIGEALSKAQGRLDVEELGRLAESKTLTASKIPELIEAEQARALAYNNKLIRAAAKGEPGAERIKPSEFVRYASEMDPADASRVMGILSDQPELVQDIRQLAIENIWSRARAGVPGQERISSTLLDDALGDPTRRATWRVILGNDTVESMKTFMDVISKREFGAQTFKGGGRLAGASDISRLFLKGEVGSLPEIASRFVLGFLYSGPLKRSITNLATHQDRGRFLNGVIASTPFIESLVDRFGTDGAFLVMNTLRDAIEPIQKKAFTIEGKIKSNVDPKLLNEDEFKQWLQNNLRQ